MKHVSSYVLVTAAYNEGNLIENTIRSVVAQDLRPVKWVIVSDGSTDSTDAIVRHYAAEHSFIQLLRLTEDHPRNFAAQAHAINAGVAQLNLTSCDFIGNLDADITIEHSYYARLIEKFHDEPKLGIAGGFLSEKGADGVYRCRPKTSTASVAHAVQLFRWNCFQSIGSSYLPLPYGGPDTYAETCARMSDWQVTSFPDVIAYHHRVTGSAGGMLRGCFRQGRMDHSLGTSPVYELFRVCRRLNCAPFVLGAMSRLAGFIYSYCRGERPAVSAEFITYLRGEQTHRIASVFRPRNLRDSL